MAGDNSWESSEAAVRAALAPVLSEFQPAYSEADRVLRGLASSQATVDAPYGRVRSILFPRIADDLKGIWLLASRGYREQAFSLGASVSELGAVVVKIGRSDDAALAWLNWDKVHKASPWSVAQAWKSLDTWESSGLGAGMYVWYQCLCLSKHANPNLQAQLPRSLSAAQHYLNADPDFTPGMVGTTALSLALPLNAAVVALASMDGPALRLPADFGYDQVEPLFQENDRVVHEVLPTALGSDGGG